MPGDKRHDYQATPSSQRKGKNGPSQNMLPPMENPWQRQSISKPYSRREKEASILFIGNIATLCSDFCAFNQSVSGNKMNSNLKDKSLRNHFFRILKYQLEIVEGVLRI